MRSRKNAMSLSAGRWRRFSACCAVLACLIANVPSGHVFAAPGNSLPSLGRPVMYGRFDESRALPAAKIEHRFLGWMNSADEYGVHVRQAASDGKVVLLSWEPRRNPIQPFPNPDDQVILQNIGRGLEDGYIRAVARALRDSRASVIVRFAHEMELENNGLHPWAGLSPEQFVVAWRRVVDLFRAEGASDVKFLWAPAGMGGPNGKLYALPYWPGETYVDYTGFSMFVYWEWEEIENPAFRQTHAVRSPDEMFAWGAQQLSTFRKPVIVAEMGVSLHPSVASQRIGWLARAAENIAMSKYAGIVAVVYFNARHNWSDTGPGADWRLRPEEEFELRSRFDSVPDVSPPPAVQAAPAPPPPTAAIAAPAPSSPLPAVPAPSISRPSADWLFSGLGGATGLPTPR